MVYSVDYIRALGEPERYYHGYMIVLPIDIRYLLDAEEDQSGIEYYRARRYGENKNKVIIRYPAWDYCNRNDRDQFKKTIPATCAIAMDEHRHDFEDDEKRHWKYLLLTFPQDHDLKSSVIYDGAGESEDLEGEVIEDDMKHKSLETISTVHYIAFYVARNEIKARKRGAVERPQKKSKTSMLLDKLRKNQSVTGTKLGDDYS